MQHTNHDTVLQQALENEVSDEDAYAAIEDALERAKSMGFDHVSIDGTRKMPGAKVTRSGKHLNASIIFSYADGSKVRIETF